MKTCLFSPAARRWSPLNHSASIIISSGPIAICQADAPFLHSTGLNAIATDPSYQHRGAASLLIAQGCRLAEEEVTAGHGLDIFSACTTQANKNMHTIWERHGFEIVDSEPVEGELSVFAGLRRASKQER